MVLAIVLVSAAIFLMFAALVVRPDESHGTTEAAAVENGHETDEQEPAGATNAESEHVETTESTTGDTVEHEDTPEVTTGETDEHAATSEGTSGGESEQGGAGHDQPEVAHDDLESDSVLGIDRESINLASPRLTIGLTLVTVLLAIGLAIRRSTALLVACVGLGLAGVVIGMYEATRAGEELGIFVPLPVLSSVLYLGAASLAGLALVSSRGGSTRQERSSRRGHATRP